MGVALPHLPGQVSVVSGPAGTKFVESVHAYHEICVMHSGQMRVTVGEETVTVGPGEMLFIPAGEVHTPETLTDVTMTFLALTRS